MRKLLAFLMCAGSVYAVPEIKITLDFQTPDSNEAITLLQATEPRLVVALEENGQPYTDLNSYTGKLFIGTTASDASFITDASVNVNPGKGAVIFDLDATDTNTNGSFTAWAILYNSAGRQFYTGNFALTIDAATFPNDAASVELGQEINYSSGTTFTGVNANGPYRAGTNITFTAGTNGSVNINSTGGGGGSGDLTEVQASGGLLTVASGTGPIPIVGLTTADVLTATADYVTETEGDARYLPLTGGTLSGDLTVATDIINRYADGLTVDRQQITILANGSTVTARVEKVGGGDLEFVFDGEVHLLSGPSDVALTAGTDTTPTLNYIYTTDGGATATLTASTSFPTGEFSMLATALLRSAATTQTEGAFMLQRWSDPISHGGRSKLAHTSERVRQEGAYLLNGASVSVTDDEAGSVSVNTASGTVYQHHQQNWDAITNGTIHLINHPTAYTSVTNLNQITVDSDGDTITQNKYYSLWIAGGMASSGTASSTNRLFGFLPTGIYNSQSDAESDPSQFESTAIPESLRTVIFPLSRIIIQKTAAGADAVLVEDRRFKTLSDRGGGGVAQGHDAVTLAGEDFLSLSGQQITAGKISQPHFAEGYHITNPKTYTGTNVTIDAAYEYVRFTPSTNFVVSYTNSLTATNTWDVRIELVNGASYSQTWGFTNTLWKSGDGTVSNANNVAAIALHGLSTNVISAFELEGN